MLVSISLLPATKIWVAAGQYDSGLGNPMGVPWEKAKKEWPIRRFSPTNKATPSAGFMARAAEFFASHGIARLEAVRTDNHWSYTKSHTLKTVLETLNANHIRIRRHCSWQNGEVERFNRTLQIEWAYRQVYSNNNERTQARRQHSTTTTTQDDTAHSERRPPISRQSPT